MLPHSSFLSGLHMAKILHSSRNKHHHTLRLHSRQENTNYLGSAAKSRPPSSDIILHQQEGTGSMRWHNKGEVNLEVLPRMTCHKTELYGVKFSLPFWDSCTHCQVGRFPDAVTLMGHWGRHLPTVAQPGPPAAHSSPAIPQMSIPSLNSLCQN